jgi:hypothetical protein
LSLKLSVETSKKKVGAGKVVNLGQSLKLPFAGIIQIRFGGCLCFSPN